MGNRFARSADRHGISRERAAYVIDHCGQPFDDPEDTDVVLYLGDDWNGVALEVGGIALDDGDLLVIHAMPLRPKFQDMYERALPWRP